MTKETENNSNVRFCAYCGKALDENTVTYCDETCEELKLMHNRDYYERNKEKIIAANTEYAKAHPELRRKISHDYFANMTDEQRKERYAKQSAYKTEWARKNRQKKKQEALDKAFSKPEEDNNE